MMISRMSRILLRPKPGCSGQAGAAAATTTAVRFLNVHEHISMEIMQSHGIRTPKYCVASTVDEAEHIFSNVLNQREFHHRLTVVPFHKWIDDT
jgi:acyl-CoA synthetase (NDP forming)